MTSRREFLAALAFSGVIVRAQPQQSQVYRDRQKTPLEYNGPGRDEADPKDLREIRIGWFGPPDAEDPQGGQQWMGANLAIDEANRNGGYRGLPFRLMSAWAANPWAGGAAQLIRLIYNEKVWAVLGGIDGATTHLAEQVVTKTLVTLINPAATDRSIHTANVPWMFSCAPGDHLLAHAISGELKRRGVTFAVVSAVDHDSRALIAELKTAFARDRIGPNLHVEFDGTTSDADRIVKLAVADRPQAAVFIAGASETAALVRGARKSRFGGTVLCGPAIAKATREPALAGALYPIVGDIPPTFRARFRTQRDAQPDYTAAQAYDAATVAVSAIRKAGLNRARIRDAVRDLAPFQGVTGAIDWDAVGQNRRPVKLGIL